MELLLFFDFSMLGINRISNCITSCLWKRWLNYKIWGQERKSTELVFICLTKKKKKITPLWIIPRTYKHRTNYKLIISTVLCCKWSSLANQGTTYGVTSADDDTTRGAERFTETQLHDRLDRVMDNWFSRG